MKKYEEDCFFGADCAIIAPGIMIFTKNYSHGGPAGPVTIGKKRKIFPGVYFIRFCRSKTVPTITGGAYGQAAFHLQPPRR